MTGIGEAIKVQKVKIILNSLFPHIFHTVIKRKNLFHNFEAHRETVWSFSSPLDRPQVHCSPGKIYVLSKRIFADN